MTENENKPDTRATIGCGKCVFYNPRNDREGLCRRYPPTMLMFPHQKVDIANGSQGVQLVPSAVLPPVNQIEWCGEFRPVPKQ